MSIVILRDFSFKKLVELRGFEPLTSILSLE